MSQRDETYDRMGGIFLDFLLSCSIPTLKALRYCTILQATVLIWHWWKIVASARCTGYVYCRTETRCSQNVGRRQVQKKIQSVVDRKFSNYVVGPVGSFHSVPSSQTSTTGLYDDSTEVLATKLVQFPFTHLSLEDWISQFLRSHNTESMFTSLKDLDFNVAESKSGVKKEREESAIVKGDLSGLGRKLLLWNRPTNYHYGTVNQSDFLGRL